MLDQEKLDQEQMQHLIGGRRLWWDVVEGRMVPSATIYVAYGCPDWGEPNGVRNQLCQFCGLPGQVAEYRQAFYDGRPVPLEDHVRLFRKTLAAIQREGEIHTLMIFNAGSFLAMWPHLQADIMREVSRYPGIVRVVVESRATLITKEKLEPLVEILSASGKKLTIRVGVETKDDHLRLKVLKKGHSRMQLNNASSLMHSLGVLSGGYVLLNPAPGFTPEEAEREATATLDWVLGSDGLAMDEAYLGPTCVSPNTALAREWEAGKFNPPSLSAVKRVLADAIAKHGNRVHLLRFKDAPPFLAVPSNEKVRGLPESLEGASPSDRRFHEVFEQFRETMDASILTEVA